MALPHIRPLAALLASLCVGGMASAAPQLAARTRLQHCGSETCLLVKGYRSDPAARVLLAGHDVPVQGMRKWRAALPLGTVRAWSAPAAQTIAVEVEGDGGAIAAPLPIGLLGHGIELAFLEVRAH